MLVAVVLVLVVIMVLVLVVLVALALVLVDPLWALQCSILSSLMVRRKKFTNLESFVITIVEINFQNVSQMLPSSVASSKTACMVMSFMISLLM